MFILNVEPARLRSNRERKNHDSQQAVVMWITAQNEEMLYGKYMDVLETT